MTQRGFGYVHIAVVLAMAAAIGFGVRWIYSAGVQAGTDRERAAWQKRELEQQRSYQAELERQRRAKDDEIGRLQGNLATADKRYQAKKEEADREKTRSDRFIADVRAGRIVLIDPGGAAGGQPGGGAGTASAATAGGCDGAPREPGRLSPELGAFLFSEADRADEVITDLEVQLRLAQDVVGAYYAIARSCQMGTRP